MFFIFKISQTGCFMKKNTANYLVFIPVGSLYESIIYCKKLILLFIQYLFNFVHHLVHRSGGLFEGLRRIHVYPCLF